MVISDDQNTYQLCNNILESEGFATAIVADDNVTRLLLDQFEPDLVILDCGTPGVENFRELYRIRIYTDVPIITLADNYEMDSLRRAFYLGADDYIRKPFERQVFLARIRAKLRRARVYNHVPSPVMT